MNSHLHKFRFDTEITEGHKHLITGCTDVMLGINNFHLHYFSGISSYNNHTHYLAGYTGFPIKTENGHIHKIEGLLEMNNLHEHKFKNLTSEEIEYTNKRRMVKEALV